MPKNNVIIIDGAERTQEIDKGYWEELKKYCTKVHGLVSRYFKMTLRRKRADGSIKVEEYYYTYEYRDRKKKPVKIPLDYYIKTKKEKSKYLREKELTIHRRFVGTEDPTLNIIPNPPKNPLEGLAYKKRGNDIIIEKKSYEDFKHLFKGFEVSE